MQIATVGAGIRRATNGAMAFRQFSDEAGTEWTVYDVVPRADERRANNRRDTSQFVDESQLDRRGEDRRATQVSVRPVRLTSGWLCFEAHGERRRLQPIPEKWHLMSDTDLEGLLQQARVAPRRVKPDQGAGARRP
jgi:hypothetical protein